MSMSASILVVIPKLAPPFYLLIHSRP